LADDDVAAVKGEGSASWVLSARALGGDYAVHFPTT
jgi:hypothetical protein